MDALGPTVQPHRKSFRTRQPTGIPDNLKSKKAKRAKKRHLDRRRPPSDPASKALKPAPRLSELETAPPHSKDLKRQHKHRHPKGVDRADLNQYYIDQDYSQLNHGEETLKKIERLKAKLRRIEEAKRSKQRLHKHTSEGTSAGRSSSSNSSSSSSNSVNKSSSAGNEHHVKEGNPARAPKQPPRVKAPRQKKKEHPHASYSKQDVGINAIMPFGLGKKKNKDPAEGSPVYSKPNRKNKSKAAQLPLYEPIEDVSSDAGSKANLKSLDDLVKTKDSLKFGELRGRAKGDGKHAADKPSKVSGASKAEDEFERLRKEALAQRHQEEKKVVDDMEKLRLEALSHRELPSTPRADDAPPSATDKEALLKQAMEDERRQTLKDEERMKLAEMARANATAAQEKERISEEQRMQLLQAALAQRDSEPSHNIDMPSNDDRAKVVVNFNSQNMELATLAMQQAKEASSHHSGPSAEERARLAQQAIASANVRTNRTVPSLEDKEKLLRHVVEKEHRKYREEDEEDEEDDEEEED